MLVDFYRCFEAEIHISESGESAESAHVEIVVAHAIAHLRVVVFVFGDELAQIDAFADHIFRERFHPIEQHERGLIHEVCLQVGGR